MIIKKSNTIIFFLLMAVLISNLAWFFIKTSAKAECLACPDSQTFVEMIMKGMSGFADAEAAYGHADANYDNAERNYEEGYYSVAEYYADDCDLYYNYAYNRFLDAEAFFEKAEEYAVSNKTLALAELYSNYANYSSAISGEMHQACEYFSGANNYYALGYWENGNHQIELMNDHIRQHDSLVASYNRYFAEIKVLLETM